MRAVRIAGVIGGILGLVLVGGASPAMAGAPIDKGTFHDVDTSSSATDPEWPCTTLGFAVTITSDVRGSFHFGPRKPGGVNYGQESVHGTISFSANGSTYTNVFNVLNKDQKVTANSNGTLTVIAKGTGSDKWFLNGKLKFSNPGQIQSELLITNPGQATEQVDFVRIVRESTGLNNGPTRTFCEDLAEFLAP